MASNYEIDAEPMATAEEWLIPDASDRNPEILFDPAPDTWTRVQYEPTPYDLGITDNAEADWDSQVPFTLTPEGEAAAGPDLPGIRDLWAVQQASCEPGLSEADYGRLVLERQQTEAAYLEGHDRQLARECEAGS